MQRWSFNYRLFIKKNMTGLLAASVFAVAAAAWDNGLMLKSVALAEVLPDGRMTVGTLAEIYDKEKEIKVVTEKKRGVKEDKEYNNEENNEEKKTVDPGKLFVMSEEEKKLYSDTNYLKKNFYIVDSRTAVLDGELNGEKFINTDFSIDTEGDGPKILIFHTHSHESFADSNMAIGKEEGIVGTGEYLKEILENEYGIETLHCTESFDYVDSRMTTTGAYERMEPAIEQILADNPSIEIAIDLHRDGVTDETKKLVTEINGKTTAQIMFFNGLCRIYENGNLVPAEGLDNPYLEENLAFSFTMKYAGDKLYPGFVRRNYLNAYRYSLNMLPKSLLVEVGAQNNTKEEAMNAMEPLAEILVSVINK
ncbi:MAG: stage II sporulation protein P [Clostridia bacterium]|nr:stage II sporulation protein P [Clostridia bacterium]